MGTSFSSGRAAIAICGRCSRKMPYLKLSSDPNVPGLRVCHGCKDKLDPYRLPPRQPDPFALRYPRPDSPLIIPPVNVIVVEEIGYVAEDGTTQYTSEDGMNNYVPESSSPPDVSSGYVAEDGTTQYTSEDGTQIYIPESDTPDVANYTAEDGFTIITAEDGSTIITEES